MIHYYQINHASSPFPDNKPSRKGKGNESGKRKMYLCHWSVIVDVLNVLMPGNSVTVPIATEARFLDLVNEVMKMSLT